MTKATLFLSTTEIRMLEDMAEALGVTVGELVSIAVSEYLEKRNERL